MVAAAIACTIASVAAKNHHINVIPHLPLSLSPEHASTQSPIKVAHYTPHTVSQCSKQPKKKKKRKRKKHTALSGKSRQTAKRRRTNSPHKQDDLCHCVFVFQAGDVSTVAGNAEFVCKVHKHTWCASQMNSA
jgi:hypothetical protein